MQVDQTGLRHLFGPTQVGDVAAVAADTAEFEPVKPFGAWPRSAHERTPDSHDAPRHRPCAVCVLPVVRLRLTYGRGTGEAGTVTVGSEEIDVQLSRQCVAAAIKEMACR